MRKLIFTLGFIITACVANAQVLYGTTAGGGKNNSGTICKLATANNSLTAEFSFDNTDGVQPQHVKLVQASNGKLYGMTFGGGAAGIGTIFSYGPSDSSYSVLLDFATTDAAYPSGSLIQTSDGKFYGMTSSGGTRGRGVIFSFDIATLQYRKLKDFNRTDGADPYGSLIQASDGKLYGMTSSGGSHNAGVIFSFDPATVTYTRLKDFNNTDGGFPNGSLMQALNGKLYGMTWAGGIYNSGVIFSFDPATLFYAKLSDLYYPTGAGPYGSLIQATDGNLYGLDGAGGLYSNGAIFSFNPVTLIYTKLYDFDIENGGGPLGDLFQASDGNLYGMTPYGGNNGGYGVIFSFDPVTSVYAKLFDFDNTNGYYAEGSFMQAADKRLYAVTAGGGISDYGVIFSFDINASSFAKLHDFPSNYSGSTALGPLISDRSGKLYGMTAAGGIYGAGTIFSYDANTSVFKKLNDFDYTNGARPSGSLLLAKDGKLYGMTALGGLNGSGALFSYDTFTSVYTKLLDFDANDANPDGGLIQATDGKLYGMTSYGNVLYGTLFSYDPVTSAYKTLVNFTGENGEEPRANLVQATDGKLYGMTYGGGAYNKGVIFSYDPVTSTYTKLKDLNSTDGCLPFGGLIQAADGKLYGMTFLGGSNNYGVIFSFDPATLIYTRLKDFNKADGTSPFGSLVEASDGKLYGMTNTGGSNGYGVAFSFDPVTLTYTKLSDFTGANGSNPVYTSFTELPVNAGLQISIADKPVTEGNLGSNFTFVPVTLNEKDHTKPVLVQYHFQNITANAGSDYIKESATLVFPPGIKKLFIPVRIISDMIPEANETFEIVLTKAVNAIITDSSSVVTILNDDSSTANTLCSFSLSPNPGRDKVQVMFNGYAGNIVLQLSRPDGKILQEEKLHAYSNKLVQQMDISDYAEGNYLITVIDEKGNRQTKKLIVAR